MKEILAIALLSVTLIANATPTFSEVEDAIARGDKTAAKAMMVDVMKKRPESVRAQKLNAMVEGINSTTIPVPAEKNSVLKTVFGAICAVALAVAGFLLFQYYRIWKRSKAPVVVKKPVSPVVAEIDKANYSTQLTAHSV